MIFANSWPTQEAQTHPVAVQGIADVADLFDLFLVDQFGVLHDGIRACDGAAAALAAIARRGKSAVIITNSGKRAAPNQRRMAALGVPRSSYAALVSSGEVAWRGLLEESFGAPFGQNRKAYLIGKPGADYGLDDLGLHFVGTPQEAEFILIHGSDVPQVSLDEYRDLLSVAGERAIPALCCNPDRTMFTRTGLQPAPGAIAALYRSLGGPVTYVGKPHAAIFAAARAVVPPVAPERILVVGDSIEHDVRGGRDAGFGAALVRTGILADADAAALAGLYTSHGCAPDFVLPSFRWA